MTAAVSDQGSAGDGGRDVVFVLLLVQAGAVLLASVGELVMMASPLYAVVPLAKAALLVWIGGRVVRGGRRAPGAAIVVQWLGLLGVWLGMVVGLLPQLTATLTVAGLLTQMALPVAVIVLCARLLAEGTPDRSDTLVLAGSR